MDDELVNDQPIPENLDGLTLNDESVNGEKEVVATKDENEKETENGEGVETKQESEDVIRQRMDDMDNATARIGYVTLIGTAAILLPIVNMRSVFEIERLFTNAPSTLTGSSKAVILGTCLCRTLLTDWGVKFTEEHSMMLDVKGTARVAITQFKIDECRISLCPGRYIAGRLLMNSNFKKFVPIETNDIHDLGKARLNLRQSNSITKMVSTIRRNFAELFKNGKYAVKELAPAMIGYPQLFPSLFGAIAGSVLSLDHQQAFFPFTTLLFHRISRGSVKPRMFIRLQLTCSKEELYKMGKESLDVCFDHLYVRPERILNVVRGIFFDLGPIHPLQIRGDQTESCLATDVDGKLVALDEIIARFGEDTKLWQYKMAESDPSYLRKVYESSPYYKYLREAMGNALAAYGYYLPDGYDVDQEVWGKPYAVGNSPSALHAPMPGL